MKLNDELLKDEVVLLTRLPQPKLVWTRFFNNLPLIVVLAVPACMLLSLCFDIDLWVVGLELAVLFSLIKYFLLCRKVQRCKYIFTNKRCIIYSGFDKNKRIIPYNRIEKIGIQGEDWCPILSNSQMDHTLGQLLTVAILEKEMSDTGTASILRWLFVPSRLQTLLSGLTRSDAEEILHIVRINIEKHKT